jgi:hypothetical protein
LALPLGGPPSWKKSLLCSYFFSGRQDISIFTWRSLALLAPWRFSYGLLWAKVKGNN